MKNGKENTNIERSETTRVLKCELNQAEELSMGQELADAHSELASINDEMETIKASIKGRIQAEEGRISRLSATIRAGYVHRQVICATVKDWKSKTVTVTRLDTMTVIEERPMTDDELQMSLLPDSTEGDANGDQAPDNQPPPPADDIPASQIEMAIQIVRETKRATVSAIQRRMRVGYPTACRIIDILEEKGIIGPANPNGAREILDVE